MDNLMKYDLQKKPWAFKIFQQGKMPTAKPDILSSNPGSHMREGENQFLQVVP